MFTPVRHRLTNFSEKQLKRVAAQSNMESGADSCMD